MCQSGLPLGERSRAKVGCRLGSIFYFEVEYLFAFSSRYVGRMSCNTDFVKLFFFRRYSTNARFAGTSLLGLSGFDVML
jgi:hypothetical protein